MTAGDRTEEASTGRGTAGAPVDGSRSTSRRRWPRVALWLVLVAVWVVVCFTWLFPLATEMGLDPTLGG